MQTATAVAVKTSRTTEYASGEMRLIYWLDRGQVYMDGMKDKAGWWCEAERGGDGAFFVTNVEMERVMQKQPFVFMPSKASRA